jgi:hypothetical protein
MLKVFAVMPFSEALFPIWEAGIRAACDDLKFECLRSDLIGTPGTIITQVCDSIGAADVVVGEVSERNPNVFYEIGFAHALGKETILLATSSDNLIAFDLQHRRHFLHGGDPQRVREHLIKTLRASEQQRLAVENNVPGGVILYEWPSAAFPPPKFTWHSNKAERLRQLDADGGQRIIKTDTIGELICISNTDELWNHGLEHSIMTLPFSRDLAVGDTIHLFLDYRATATAIIDFVGDGGWVEGPAGRKWAHVWPILPIQIRPAVTWTREPRSVTVAPTCGGYDLKRGAAIYLMTTSKGSTVFLRRIRLVRRPAS